MDLEPHLNVLKEFLDSRSGSWKILGYGSGEETFNLNAWIGQLTKEGSKLLVVPLRRELYTEDYARIILGLEPYLFQNAESYFRNPIFTTGMRRGLETLH
jgi:hypothetical protein